jgi:hypothetical protein
LGKSIALFSLQAKQSNGRAVRGTWYLASIPFANLTSKVKLGVKKKDGVASEDA